MSPDQDPLQLRPEVQTRLETKGRSICKHRGCPKRRKETTLEMGYLSPLEVACNSVSGCGMTAPHPWFSPPSCPR